MGREMQAQTCTTATVDWRTLCVIRTQAVLMTNCCRLRIGREMQAQTWGAGQMGAPEVVFSLLLAMSVQSAVLHKHHQKNKLGLEAW